MPPTRDDATLMVQLAHWGTTLGVNDALQVLLSERFDPERIDARTHAGVASVLHFGETVGTLVKNGLIDRELMLDWMWFEGIWRQVGPAAVKLRGSIGDPGLYANFEALAASAGGGT